MPTNLANIRTFDQLLKYLEEELDWPIDDMEVHDLTFDYDAENDLGLDPAIAAKIKNNTIKQLRPLSSNQPFGIFFVEFEPKRLPVVALRRILGKLVTRKRESANPAERATWQQDDLIFASAYGAEDTRRIEFAHFADDHANGLPTLRVLGWDDADPDRKLARVEHRLKERLSWPDDASPTEWRTQWRSAFSERHREVINTSRKLAEHLAALAKDIRARVLEAIAIETDKGHLRKLHKAFQDSLIHDLDRAQFADMYAQTIAYGLLSARMSRPAGLVADDAALMIPNTNPFLRDLMEEFLRVGGRDKKAANGAGIDFDELGVNDVVELLREANMEAVIADFGKERPGEDPVIHFYEYFMVLYDKKQKVSRGVFYTPRPVVSFIVRSVDEILREEFGLPLGLADTTTWGEMAKRFASLPQGGAASLPPSPGGEGRGEGAPPKPFTIPDTVKPEDHFVQILDPATGTGTFLVETIDLIHKRMLDHWKAQKKTKTQIDTLWNEYVADHLLPRLYGFELMMAPYAIAHMKIGLKLADTGYRFQSSQRLRVFLTNALEPPTDLSEMLEFEAEAIAKEARKANATKASLRPTVVIGNPPYAQMSSNLSESARKLIRDYRFVDGAEIQEKSALSLERNLNDDYVKFMRLAESHLEYHQGVLGFITNNSYLDAATLRGLRAHLLHTFGRISIVNLHGDSDKKDRADDGTRDENIFEIKKGVAICLMVRGPAESDMPRVESQSVRGTSGAKGAWLAVNSIRACDLTATVPDRPLFLLIPIDPIASGEYRLGFAIDECFPETATGFTSGFDDLLTAFDAAELVQQLSLFANADEEEVASKFRCTGVFAKRLLAQRGLIASDADFTQSIRPFLFEPFDVRQCYYRPRVLMTASHRVGRHLLNRPNIALMAMRQVSVSSGFSHVFVTSKIPNNRAFYSTKGKVNYFPLWLYSKEGEIQIAEGQPNLSTEVLQTARAVFDEASIHPEVLFSYIYAFLHSPEYRRRYRTLLTSQFARILFPTAHPLCAPILASLGADLIALHLLEDDYPHASWNQVGAKNANPLATPITTFHDDGDREVRKVAEKGKTMAPSATGTGFGRVYINDTAYFDGVPEAVWNFHIGGYQVCHKWLSDRKGKGSGKKRTPGRTLTDDDIAHYHRIVIALNETIRLMGEIDEVIDAHGGWPGAFVTGKGEGS